MDLYPWLVLAHVAGGFGLMLGHGTSVMCAFKLRGERDMRRIEAMLDLSSYSLGLLYLSLLVLLASGIAAGFIGNHWGRLWIWAALGVLIAVIAAMYTIASSFYSGVRRALGQKVSGDPKDAPPPTPAPPEEVLALLASPRPYVLAVIGGAGLLAILWLMLLKPF
jgi:hypothetical protein